MVIASGLLATIVGGAFAFVLLTITELRGTTDLRRQTREALVGADTLEAHLIDLETGLRGFVITRDDSFLQPYNDARAALPASARALVRLAAGEPVQLARVQRIVAAMNAYLRQYALPLVGAVRRNDPAARSVARTLAAKQRIDALREGLTSFREAERARLGVRDADVDTAARRATAAAAVGVAGSMLLIFLFALYLTRVIVHPLRRAEGMASRLAGGDLSARMRDTDIAEIGALERSFNVMADSLEKSRDELASLLAEQAALRRVATLVAREASQAEVFAAIAEEIGELLGAAEVRMLRLEQSDSAVVVGSSGEANDILQVGSSHLLGGENATSRVFRTGKSARMDDYGRASGPIAERVRSAGIRAVVGAPILVEGGLWGAMVAATTQDESLPPETEARLGQFTELMATAIANTESHARADRLAEEQAALRRVATLVAEGAAPSVVLDAVAAEMEALLDADHVSLNRYEPGSEILVLARRGLDPARTPVGSRLSHEGESVTATARRTGRPARMEHREGDPGVLAQLAQATGLRFSVGAPIVVEGRPWGVITASWKGDEPPPPDTEARVVQFAQLLDTAIASADGRDQLTASRARLLTAGDDARRHVVRDLHDGAQQRLVHTIITLKMAQRALRHHDDSADELVGQAIQHAEQATEELRELAHGILPAVLSRGLAAAVDAVVARLTIPVHVDVPERRFPAEIEASAFFIVAEALTNVVKHSDAGRAEVSASAEDGVLRVAVRDDGIGGADPHGHGLVGLGDRAAALGGRLEIDSPVGGGTLLAATLPLSTG
jgi:signal transduction histidine kinase/CHASE3 domain sensor protein